MKKEKTIIECDVDDLKKVVEELILEEIKDSIYGRFRNRIVDSMTACKVLGISPSTLQRYIHDGRLVPIKKGRNYKFDLGDLMSQDLNKGRHTPQFIYPPEKTKKSRLLPGTLILKNEVNV